MMQSTRWRRTSVSNSSFEPSYDIIDEIKEKLFKIAKKYAFEKKNRHRRMFNQICFIKINGS